MIQVRDGLSFSNENSTLAAAIARFLANRKAQPATRPAGNGPVRAGGPDSSHCKETSP